LDCDRMSLRTVLMDETIIDDARIPTVTIRPPKKWLPINFYEIRQYHELLYFFIWRDVKIRYKQTVLGVLWAIIPPLFLMVVFSLFFGNFAQISSEGIPYPLFSFAALIPWGLFSEGLTRSTMGMVSNAHIMTKVYFPRLIVPLAAILSPLIDFVIAMVILFLMMAYYGYFPTIAIILLPIFILLTLLTSLSVGLWLSSLNVKYRDFQYIIPFLTQIWFFLSPIVYPASMIPEQWQFLYALNPMTGVIEGFRWALLGTSPPEYIILVSAAVVVLILIGGLFYFRKMEQYFADLV
jgi:lipopolysaccharide transport system permease protein